MHNIILMYMKRYFLVIKPVTVISADGWIDLKDHDCNFPCAMNKLHNICCWSFSTKK